MRTRHAFVLAACAAALLAGCGDADSSEKTARSSDAATVPSSTIASDVEGAPATTVPDVSDVAMQPCGRVKQKTVDGRARELNSVGIKCGAALRAWSSAKCSKKGCTLKGWRCDSFGQSATSTTCTRGRQQLIVG